MKHQVPTGGFAKNHFLRGGFGIAARPRSLLHQGRCCSVHFHARGVVHFHRVLGGFLRRLGFAGFRNGKSQDEGKKRKQHE